MTKLVDDLNDISDRVRRGEVDDELLAYLGIAGEELRNVGRAFDKSTTQDKQIEALTRDADLGKEGERGNDAAGSDAIHESEQKTGAGETVRIDSGDLPPDEVRKLVESGDVDISPEYRRLIERYFGELSEQ